MSRVQIDAVEEIGFPCGMGEIHQLILLHGLEQARAMAASPAERQAIEAAAAVLGDEGSRLGVTHAGFAMTALPHRRIREAVWKRDGGAVTLLVESGLQRDGVTRVGVPYGALARMILLYLQTQAAKTRSREVELGASMNAWLTAMGISVGGKTYALVREQARRISACRLTFLRPLGDGGGRINAAFIREEILPSPPAEDRQLSLWQERVTLDEGFYRSLMEHPLPLREAALREIVGRSLAIDLYIWLAYRLHVLQRPLAVSWAALQRQFGESYSASRFFRRDVQPALRMALAVYPEALVEVGEAGLTLNPSPPPVVERHRRLGQN